jgi:hypothetical protein
MEASSVTDVDACLARRFAGNSEQTRAILKHVLKIWHNFNNCGFAQGEFNNGICSEDDATFCQYYWEMLLANQLTTQGLAPQRPSKGPDFRIESGGRTVWVEATAPTPGTGPDQIPDRFVDPIAFIREQRRIIPDYTTEAFSPPTEQYILRWTTRIKNKWQKWVTYLAEGTVSASDAYVIAINACNLGFAGLHAVEQYEVALRSVFPFGDIKTTWSIVTREIVDVAREHKSFVPKCNEKHVQTDMFLDEAYSSISAIIATNTSPLIVPYGRPYFEFAVIHNPLATVKLDVGLLGANVEFVPYEDGDHYRLDLVGS